MGAIGRSAQKITAHDGAVSFAESGRQLLNTGVMLRFCLAILGIAIAVKETDHHEHTGDGATYLPQSSHTAAKGGGKTEGCILIQTQLIAEGKENGLGAVIALKEEIFRFFTVVHGSITPLF